MERSKAPATPDASVVAVARTGNGAVTSAETLSKRSAIAGTVARNSGQSWDGPIQIADLRGEAPMIKSIPTGWERAAVK